ncbi:beta-1,3-galactosyltransferase 5-like [Dermacentor variabilis]|uniref:beta-1,3-galactosyltransferase 5-like n=1 Tax=Dermacentor variabilis TaxID=34621 RepID=UPI003F5C92D3
MDFVVVFLLGKTLDQEVQRKVFAEQDLYGDIVQGDFLDTYRNLTYKTVMLIRWARVKCSGVHFMLKTDDDMLVSVWDLAIVVNGLEGVKRTMWGYLHRNSTPHRNVSSKWYVSRKEYAPDTYPPYLSGSGYLISGDSIAALEELTHDECFFPFEDVYLTSIVAQRAQHPGPRAPPAAPVATPLPTCCLSFEHELGQPERSVHEAISYVRSASLRTQRR